SSFWLAPPGLRRGPRTCRRSPEPPRHVTDIGTRDSKHSATASSPSPPRCSCSKSTFTRRTARNSPNALTRIWPSYLAYVTSFITIGIIFRAIDRGFAPGLPLYTLVFGLAFFTPLAAVILTLLLAAFYLP